MSLSSQDVAKVASLARLSLSADELEAARVDLAGILDYVGMLDELITDGVAPMVHAIDTHNAFREDQVRPSLPLNLALSNAPKTDGRSFLVPAIIGE